MAFPPWRTPRTPTDLELIGLFYDDFQFGVFTEYWFAHLCNSLGFLLFNCHLPLSHLCESKANTKLWAAALDLQGTHGGLSAGPAWAPAAPSQLAEFTQQFGGQWWGAGPQKKRTKISEYQSPRTQATCF